MRRRVAEGHRRLEEQARVSFKACIAEDKAVKLLASPREVEKMLAVEVRVQIQHYLTQRGYFEGSPDGEFSAPSRIAIKKFQRALGVNQTGYLTFCELTVLQIAN